MNNYPIISVVMSVFNGEDYLREAIESILFQTYTDFEFIIVNDGSTDKSLEIIKSYDDDRIIVIDQKNIGLSKSLNKGVAASKGEFIARMDADDICHRDRFQVQVDFLINNRDCVVVGSNACYIDMVGNILYFSDCLSEWNEIKKVLPKSPFFHSSTMFSKEAFEKVGGYYDEIPQFFEDQILWNRLSKVGELWNLKQALLSYRIVPGSITAGKIAVKNTNEICQEIIVSNKTSRVNIDYINSNRMPKMKPRVKYGYYYLRLGKIYLEHNFNRKKAAMMLFKSLRLMPLNATSWFNLGLVLLPKKIVYEWKKSRGVYKYPW